MVNLLGAFFLLRCRSMVCALAFALFLPGCGREVEQKSSDPKNSFESLVKQLVPGMKGAFATGVPKLNDAILYQMQDGHTYDVRKTDSLVSPYTASLVIPIKSAHWKSSGADISDGLTEIEVLFAMQNDKWSVTGLRGKRAIKYGLRSQGEEDQTNWSGDVTNEEASLMNTISTLATNLQR